MSTTTEPLSWQPISTAPKDGTEILVYSKDGMYTAKWDDAFGFVPVWLPSMGCGCCGGNDALPTHWQPLPPAPEKEGK